MFFFICSLSVVLHHILAKKFSKGSASQHPNIILHHFITKMQTCILILLANIKPLYWGHQSCQYQNRSHYHRMVLGRRDLKDYLVSPFLHVSTLMHTGINHQCGQLRMPIPSIPVDRHSTGAADGRESQICRCLHNPIWHQFLKNVSNTTYFFFFKGMCILVCLSSLSLQ